MRRIASALAAALIITVSTFTAHGTYADNGEHKPVTATLAPVTSSLVLGDSLTVVCTVRGPSGYVFTPPAAVENDPSVETTVQWERPLGADAGQSGTSFGILTYVFEPDTLIVGPFEVTYTAPDGTTGTAVSDTVDIVVSGVVASGDEKPLPNRGPLPIPSRGIPFWLGSLLIAALAAAVAGLVWWRRRGRQTPAPPRPPEPVDELAEFERIRRMNLLEQGRVREHYTHVSVALRGFLQRNLGFDALYSTTFEIDATLAGGRYDGEVRKRVMDVFAEADMVKFARYSPPPESAATIIERAEAPVRNILDDIARERARRLAESREQQRTGDTMQPKEERHA